MKDQLFAQYATTHAWFTTRYQEEVYVEAARWLHGRVLDAGSGCSKIAPYLSDAVCSYVGVDCNTAMIREGRRLVTQLKEPKYYLCEQRIEETRGQYDSIVSVQSYYSWPDGLSMLKHLYQRLVSGGTLVLATANDRLDMELLIERCSRAWLLHPEWPTFVDHNRRLAALSDGRYVSLDTLISELQQVGFHIRETDSSYFESGLNLIVASKH